MTLFLEMWRWPMLAAITALYFAGTFAVSSTRPLWFDEIFTAYLARLDSTSQLWAALSEATDVTPPLFNLITRECVLLFGPTEFALRLPATLGYWVMSVCIFTFVYRRSSILFALAALLLPVCIESGIYASEARPYGLELGACGVAMVCWQAAVDGRRRAWAIAGLALALAGATSLHYYGALFVLPLALGEVIRIAVRRKVDWPVLAAFLAAPATLLVHAPWIRIAMTYSGGAWSALSLGAFASTYVTMLGKYMPVAIAGIVVTIGLMLFNRKRQDAPPLPAAPPWELGAIAGMMVLPIVVMAVAFVTNGIFAYRYALPCVMGFALAIAVIPLRTERLTAAVGMGYFTIFAVAFVGMEGWHLRHFVVSHEPSRVARLAGILDNQQQRVVIADPHQFLELAYYAPAEMRSRLFYIASPANARRFISFDDDDRSLLLLRRWAPLQVSEYEPFIRENSTFLLYGGPGDGWLMPKFRQEQASIRRSRPIGEKMLQLIGDPPIPAVENPSNDD